jgi:hypothetical protein
MQVIGPNNIYDPNENGFQFKEIPRFSLSKKLFKFISILSLSSNFKMDSPTGSSYKYQRKD